MQEIAHLHQVRLRVLAVEFLPNWTVLHTMDVHLGHFMVVLHPHHDLKILFLWLHPHLLSNGIKSLLVVDLDVVTDSCLQRTPVLCGLPTGVAEAADDLVPAEVLLLSLMCAAC